MQRQRLTRGPVAVLAKAFVVPLIFFPEVAGVGQAGGEDFAVAGDDPRAAVARGDVGGADEGVGEVACRVLADEVLLVHAGGELDDFGGDFEEGFVEAAQQGDGPLGQAGVFDDEAFVGDQPQAGGGGGGVGTVADQFGARGVVDDDVVAAQRLGVGLRVVDLQRAGGERGGAGREAGGGGFGDVEAVAVGHAARLDAGDFGGDDLAVEQGDDALQRADPAQAFRRDRRFAPAHRFRPRELADDVLDRGFEHLGDGAARGLRDGEPHAVALGELVGGEAGLAEEALQRLRGGGGAGAFDLLADGGGGLGQAFGDQREAAGGGPHGELQRVGDAGGGEARAEQLFQLGAGGGLHAGGDLFRAEFEEEIAHAAGLFREVRRKGLSEGLVPRAPITCRGWVWPAPLRNGAAPQAVWRLRRGRFVAGVARGMQEWGARGVCPSHFTLITWTTPETSRPTRPRSSRSSLGPRPWRDRGRDRCSWRVPAPRSRRALAGG